MTCSNVSFSKTLKWHHVLCDVSDTKQNHVAAAPVSGAEWLMPDSIYCEFFKASLSKTVLMIFIFETLTTRNFAVIYHETRSHFIPSSQLQSKDHMDDCPF